MDYNVKNFDEALKIMTDAGIEPIENQRSNHVGLSRELASLLTKQMTLKEKAYMLSGHWAMANGMLHGRVYNYDPIAGGGCKRLGIPPILFSDGPRGVVMKSATCFPTSNTRAAAFDESLEYEVGEAIAKECIALGANYFAGVCINLLRHPAWGRAQEAYGEDQFLTGKYGAALTKGLQKHGVISCPKHYYMNSIENLRFSASADADEETLRDVYLYHFEDCFNAGAGSVMSAYNKVNGTYCGENKDVFDHLKLFDFNGFSISDFVWGVHDGPESLRAGLDIEMPMTMKRGGSLVRAVKKGTLPESLLEEHCVNIISTLLRFQGIYRQQKYSKNVVCCDAHTSLARKAAEKGAVLLKNEGLLPIRDNHSKIAAVGRFANDEVIGDHGSSMAHPPYIVTPYQGLKPVYPGITLESSDDIERCSAAAKDADTVLVFVGNNFKDEGEYVANTASKVADGGDRASLRLHDEDVALIKAMKALGKKVAVIFCSGSAVIINEWEQDADAILYVGYGGMEGGNAVASIIHGDVNPSGKLPYTVAHSEEDYPYFPHTMDPDQRVEYGYWHGYAKLEKEGVKPDYPFGYGLSYTSYEYGKAEYKVYDDFVRVSCSVRNTGELPGEEAVLVFIGSGIPGKPEKLLKGFKRIALNPGEEGVCEIIIPKNDLRIYDPSLKTMIIPQNITVWAGPNIAELKKAEPAS